jgi:transketolase
VDKAIQAAKSDPRPSLIVCRTTIGFGAPNKAGTAKAHGEPLGEEELKLAKENLDWPVEPKFYLPEDALAYYRQALDCGAQAEAEWNRKFAAYKEEYPEQGAELQRRLDGEFPQGWDADLPVFPTDAKGIASRAASGKVLNALAPKLPELLGGSADLAPSNNTFLAGIPGFQQRYPARTQFSLWGARTCHGGGSSMAWPCMAV